MLRAALLALICLCPGVARAQALGAPLAAIKAGTLPTATPLPAGPSNAARDADATLVVFNEADEESRLLAQFYAQKRNIPTEQVVGLHCSLAEEITRNEYEVTIAEPLRALFTKNSWWKLDPLENPAGPVLWNRIRFVALMRGIPLKIAPAPGYPGDKPVAGDLIRAHNEAAVDSELAVLGLRLRVISGALSNPYFTGLTSIHTAGFPNLMLVARLDGPTPAIVRRMIVDSIATEEAGLHGFAYMDARATADPRLTEGDRWLYAATEDLRKNGIPVILDNGPAMFPDGSPMRSVALYFGWYSEQLAGPFARPGFRLLPGSIAVHIHSFSGVTVRDDHRNWVGPLLAEGAAATLGNVYEPYLELTPHLDIFENRLRLGFTFAESAYMSQRVVSWMTTCVGDPLYRPFSAGHLLKRTKANAEWDAYHDGALAWFNNPKAGLAQLREAARRMNSGIIWEGLALLQMGDKDHKAAAASLAEALNAFTNVDDQMQVAIHEVIELRQAGREFDADALAKKMVAAHRTSPATAVLKQLAPAVFPQ